MSVCTCIGLLDPRWIENQRRQLQVKKNEEAFSEGVQVQTTITYLLCNTEYRNSVCVCMCCDK